MLTKSDYIKYIQCQKLLWLYKNKKNIFPEVSEVDQATFDQGYEVENWARKLFGKGKEVENFFQKGQAETKKYVADGEKVIFQATAMPKDLFVRADILKYNKKTKSWDIYEVKSSTEVKEEHIPDMCFQKIAFERDGYEIGKTYLVHINNEYIKKGKIDPKKLLTIEDVSDQVENYRSTAEANIPKAIKLIVQTKEPIVEIGRHCKHPYECPLKELCWEKLPDYSIYSLGRINEKKLQALKDLKILKITDIPDDFELNEAQRNQVEVTKTRKPLIDKEAIKETLNTLEYPLYFLDYETYGGAIPTFDGTKPYQQVCFQYSLHIIRNQGAKIEHYEFLHTDQDNPMEKLLLSLVQHIGNTGSVIVWNKGFEMSRNEEMANQFPKYSKFLESVNNRVFDLMEIFKKQYYVHADFKGSCSIKKVLPVLIPELNYKNLEGIQEGTLASLYWYKHIHNNSPEKEKIIEQLLKYCELDTLAMVEIYKKLILK